MLNSKKIFHFKEVNRLKCWYHIRVYSNFLLKELFLIHLISESQWIHVYSPPDIVLK